MFNRILWHLLENFPHLALAATKVHEQVKPVPTLNVAALVGTDKGLGLGAGVEQLGLEVHFDEVTLVGGH